MEDKHDDIYSVINKREMPIKLTMTEEERSIVLQWAQKLEDEEKSKSIFYRIFH